MFKIAEETPDDFWEVEALYDLCFAPGRSALGSYRLRDGVSPVPELCLTVRDAAGILAAAVRFWPVAVNGHAVLLLGPIAVHPTRQGEGLGGLLIRESLDVARAEGWKRVLLVGDAPYYARFGFAPAKRIGMPPPTNPARILILALRDGAWSGVAGEVLPWSGAPLPGHPGAPTSTA